MLIRLKKIFFLLLFLPQFLFSENNDSLSCFPHFLEIPSVLAYFIGKHFVIGCPISILRMFIRKKGSGTKVGE
jgi:hypothetical protein